MKLLFILFFFSVPLCLFGQIFILEENDTDSIINIINVNSSFESNSNRLSNQMVGTLLWGGEMDPVFLTETRDRLKTAGNRFGFQFRNFAYASLHTDRHQWVVGIRYCEMFGLKFSEDLFGVAFLGNSSYEGKDANLSGTKLSYWNYTGVSVGMINKLTEYSDFYLSISALYGLNHQSLQAKQANLYTAPEGEFLQADGDMKITYKEPGFGLGLAINSNYLFTKGSNSFMLSVQDLGFMQFQNSATFEGTSNTRYAGENVNNLTNYTGDSLFSDFSSKGIAKKFNIHEKERNSLQLLPFTVSATFIRTITDNWKSSFDINYTYIPAYIPKTSLRLIRLFNKGWKVSSGLSYGGFGNQNLLLGLRKDFKRKWSFEMESYFLGIAIAPEQTKGGFGLSAGIRKKF